MKSLVLFVFSCLFLVSSAIIVKDDSASFELNLSERCFNNDVICRWTDNILWEKHESGEIGVSLSSINKSVITALVTWKQAFVNIELEGGKENEKCAEFQYMKEYEFCISSSNFKFDKRFDGILKFTLKYKDPSASPKAGESPTEDKKTETPEVVTTNLTSTTTPAPPNSNTKEDGWSFWTFFWVILAVLVILFVGVIYYYRHMPIIADRLSLIRGGRV